MYVADFLIEQELADPQVRNAFAAAFNVDAKCVTVWPLGQVMDQSADVVIQTSNLGGDFPIQYSVTMRDGKAAAERQAHLLEVVQELASRLQTIVITDDVGVNPAFDDDFLMVAPDGATRVVQADLDAMDEDQIVLTPASRAVHQAMLRHDRITAATG
jgi:hypothetical protein